VEIPYLREVVWVVTLEVGVDTLLCIDS
jgi:hypothetical protein